MSFSRGGVSALSSRETKVLDYLRRTITEAHCPTYQEIAAAARLSSKSQVHATIAGLRSKGWINADPYMARSIVLTDPYTGKSTAELMDMRKRIDAVLAGRAS